MVDISKSAWKLFRERVTGWQEHYMEQLNKEYIVSGDQGKGLKYCTPACSKGGTGALPPHTALVKFRKRISAGIINECNEVIIETLKSYLFGHADAANFFVIFFVESENPCVPQFAIFEDVHIA